MSPDVILLLCLSVVSFSLFCYWLIPKTIIENEIPLIQYPSKYFKSMLNIHSYCSAEIPHYISIIFMCVDEIPNLSCFTVKPMQPYLRLISNVTEPLVPITLNTSYCGYEIPIFGVPRIFEYNHNQKYQDLNRQFLKNRIKKIPNNIIMGSGHSYGFKDTKFPGFIATDQDQYDLTNRHEILQYITPGIMDLILTNHVLEHISYRDIVNSLFNFHYVLQSNGKLVICVPDLNAPTSPYSRTYEEGIAFQPRANHKMLYSNESLIFLLKKTGFSGITLSSHNVKEQKYLNPQLKELTSGLHLYKYLQEQTKGYGLCVLATKTVISE